MPVSGSTEKSPVRVWPSSVRDFLPVATGGSGAGVGVGVGSGATCSGTDGTLGSSGLMLAWRSASAGALRSAGTVGACGCTTTGGGEGTAAGSVGLMLASLSFAAGA